MALIAGCAEAPGEPLRDVSHPPSRPDVSSDPRMVLFRHASEVPPFPFQITIWDHRTNWSVDDYRLFEPVDDGEARGVRSDESWSSISTAFGEPEPPWWWYSDETGLLERSYRLRRSEGMIVYAYYPDGSLLSLTRSLGPAKIREYFDRSGELLGVSLLLLGPKAMPRGGVAAWRGERVSWHDLQERVDELHGYARGLHGDEEHARG